MQKNIPALAFFSLLLLLSFRFSTEWKTYTFKEAHFSVEFPSEPIKQDDKGKSDDGTTHPIHAEMAAVGEEEVYIASWSDDKSLKNSKQPAKEILEAARDHAAESIAGTSVKTVTLDFDSKNPFLEFKFKSEQRVGKGRIYYAQHEAYILLAIFPMQSGIKPGADKFMQSFKAL